MLVKGATDVCPLVHLIPISVSHFIVSIFLNVSPISLIITNLVVIVFILKLVRVAARVYRRTDLAAMTYASIVFRQTCIMYFTSLKKSQVLNVNTYHRFTIFNKYFGAHQQKPTWIDFFSLKLATPNNYILKVCDNTVVFRYIYIA